MIYSEVKKKHISNKKKRPGSANVLKYITVHNNANPKATADSERRYLDNPSNTSSTSWHLVVDGTQCIEAIPLDEVAYHSGSSKGNRYSIGIEICENNHTQSVEQAVELIADLLIKFDMDISCVVPHKYWSGKQCPRLILPQWNEFIKLIQKELDNMVKPANIHVMNNGNVVEVESILYEGTNYIKLRDIPKLANVTVGYDDKKNIPVIQEGK